MRRAALLGLLLAAPLAHAAGDVAAGQKVFAAECQECHSLKAGRHKKGPALHAIAGSPAAAQAGFEYSDALRSSGWTWDEATLRRYLSGPTRLTNPGTKMKYDGPTDHRNVDDLLAFLAGVK